LFTESLPQDFSDAHRLVSTMTKNDVMIIVGTSATVYPAASLPEIASRKGAKILEINLQETSFNNLNNYSFLKGKLIFKLKYQGGAGEVIPNLLNCLKHLDQ
jgi:NAD-dependent SIR2 family protein deacetylase